MYIINGDIDKITYKIGTTRYTVNNSYGGDYGIEEKDANRGFFNGYSFYRASRYFDTWSTSSSVFKISAKDKKQIHEYHLAIQKLLEKDIRISKNAIKRVYTLIQN